MFSRVAVACLLGLSACSAPVVVVAVQNPQGLSVAAEHVTLELTRPDGTTAMVTHDFAVSGLPGTFSIELQSGSSGKLHVTADLADSSGMRIGRASGTVLLDGHARADLQLRATRLLAGLPRGIVAGVPGGPGNRNGQAGAEPSSPARLDDPIAFTLLGHAGRPGDIGYILEGCGAIRRLLPIPSGANQTDQFIPCSSHSPPASSGPVSSLSLENPTAMVADPYGHPRGTPILYVADGARIVAISFPGAVDAAASTLSYTDFTALSGVSPMHISAMAIGPFQESASTTPFTTLYVADDVANVVWAYPLDGGPPTIAMGVEGPCVAALPLAEGAKAVPVAPDQTHLCVPNGLDTGSLGGKGSDPVLFVSDAGHGAARMLAPNALAPSMPGVTTLFEGETGMQAIGYRLLAPGTITYFTGEVSALFFWHQNAASFMILYANPAIGSQGVVSDLTTNNVPGYTASFDLLAGLGSTTTQQAIQFNDVSQAFRISDGNATDQIVSDSLFLVVERGNSVISHITTTDLKFEPWVGAGPQRGTSSAPSKPGLQAVFAAPAGLDWGHGTSLFVADRDNQSIAQLTYDSSVAGVKVNPLVGCPNQVGSPSLAALLSSPTQVAYDDQTSSLYVLDGNGATLRRVHLNSSGGATTMDTMFDPGATVLTDCASSAGSSTPGVLGVMSAFAFDPVQRRIWVAHASSPDLAYFDVDSPTTPGAVTLASGPVAQLAVVDRTLFAVDAAGHVSSIDLTATAPQARSALDLDLMGAAVTAVGSDGEWLYVADDSARLWRFDPLAPAATVLLGDGSRGLDLEATPPGLNRVGGLGYDGARGVLFVSDSVENTVIAIQ